MTLVSIVVVLAIKSYTINAQDRPMNDRDIEILASVDLLNKADTLRHQKMINHFVESLETSEILYGKFVGAASFPSEIYQDYERIQRVGTEEELNALLIHESPVVRLYAHQALTANGMNLDAEAIELLVNDTTSVLIQDGLEIKKVSVMDLASTYMFPTAAQ